MQRLLYILFVKTECRTCFQRNDKSLRIHPNVSVILLKHKATALLVKWLGLPTLCFTSLNALHGYIQLGLGLTVHFVPAVLAAGAPDQTAFMSDEAMESVPGLKPIQYTAKHYALYLGKMVERTEKLNKGEVMTGTQRWLQLHQHFSSLHFVVQQWCSTSVFCIVDLAHKI